MKHLLVLISLVVGINSYGCVNSAPCILVDNQNEDYFIASTKQEALQDTISDYLLSLSHQYMGVPYVYGGNNLKGIDCSAFTREIFKKLGIYLPRTSGAQFIDQRFEDVRGNFKAFDLIFFKKSLYAKISHVAIYLGHGRIIHSSKNEGGVYISEFRNSGLWQRLFFKAKRMKKINQEKLNEKITSIGY